MTSNEDKTKVDRRSFLRGMGFTAAAAPAALALGTAPAQAAEAAADQGSGYRETEHVRQAYAAARF